MHVVRNYDVGFGSVGFDKLLIRRFDVVLPAVHHVVEVVAAFFGIALHPAFELDAVLGVDEYFQVHLIGEFAEVKYKNAFDHNDGGGLEGKHAGYYVWIVENVFFLIYDLTNAQLLNVLSVQMMVNRFRQVEVMNTLVVGGYFLAGTVVVVLRDETNLILRKSTQNPFQE